MENELCEDIDNTMLPPYLEEEDVYDDFDDEFCSDSYDLFQSIEDKELIDPENDDFYDFEYEY